MILITEILGSASDPQFTDLLHAISHEGILEHLEITQRDAQRRRFRGKTDRGTDCAITLSRDTQLNNGDVLLLEAERAIVVRVDVERWLRIMPRDATVALRLGYPAGNLHWRVKFEESNLLILLEGSLENYMARLQAFITADEIEIRHDD